MKTFYRFFVYPLLAVSLILLVGCKQEESEGQKGIIISEETEYSDASLARAEEVIYDLLEHYLKQSTTAEIPAATLEKIKGVSADLAAVLDDVPLSEERFSDLLDLFAAHGKGAVDELCGKATEKGELRSLYLESCYIAGQDYVGKSLYRILVYSLDYQYEKRMNEYEKYGFSYLLDEAKSVEEDKEILCSEVGENNFVSFVRGVVSVCSLWLGDGFNSETSVNFTDEEILVFISKIDLSLELSNNGWSVLLRRLAPLLSGYDEIGFVAAAQKNGDLEKISAVMNSVSNLLCFLQASVGLDEVKYLREGSVDGIIEKAFSLFDDSEWQSFAEITSVDLKYEDYEKKCLEKYGDDFEIYRETLLTVTLDELKSSVGKDDFYKSLEGYLGGISPALSYGMRK